MARNNDSSTDAMVNAFLGGNLYYVIVSLREVDIATANEWADISANRVGTQVIHRSGLTCVNRVIDAGAALIFDQVAGGTVYAVVALTDAPGGSPFIWDVENVDGGVAYDMDTQGPLALDGIFHLMGWNGEV